MESRIQVDQAAFDKLFEDSFDDYDLAENFGFFVEDYIFFPEDSREKTDLALLALPPMIRRLYLAFIVKIAVDGDGFQSYFMQNGSEELLDETARGLRMLARGASANAFEKARRYQPFRDFTERESVGDKNASLIYSDFSDNFGDDYWDDIGKYLRQHRDTALRFEDCA